MMYYEMLSQPVYAEVKSSRMAKVKSEMHKMSALVRSISVTAMLIRLIVMVVLLNVFHTAFNAQSHSIAMLNTILTQAHMNQLSETFQDLSTALDKISQS